MANKIIIDEILEYCYDYLSKKRKIIFVKSVVGSRPFIYTKGLFEIIKDDFNSKKTARWWCKIEPSDGNIVGRIQILKNHGSEFSDLQENAFTYKVFEQQDNTDVFSWFKGNIKIVSKYNNVGILDDALKKEINGNLDEFYRRLNELERMLSRLIYCKPNVLSLRRAFDDYLSNKKTKEVFEKELFEQKDLFGEYFFNQLCSFEEEQKMFLDVKEIELSKEIKSKRYCIEGFDERIRGLNEDRPNKDVLDKMICSEEFVSFDARVLGEYYHDSKKIVLYVEAIKASNKSGKDLQDLFISVYVHELFHAFHAYMCESRGNYWPVGSRNGTIIIESLADAIQYYFIKNVLLNRNLAEDKYRMWGKHNLLVYPYSGAKVLTNNHDLQDSHPLKVLMSSDLLIVRDLIKIERVISYNNDELRDIKKYFYFSLNNFVDAERDLILSAF